MNKENLKNNGLHESYFFKAIPAFVWQFLFLYVPLGFILALSLTHDSTFTLQNYAALFNILYIKVIIRSLLIALCTAILCLIVGYPIAYFMAIRKRSLKNFFLFFLIVPFWTNFLVLTYAWFFVLDRDGFLNDVLLKIGLISEPLEILNSMIAVILVMFYAYLPFMVLPIFSILEKFDMTLIEASRDLGATMRQTLMNVILPLSMPGIKTGFLLVFVPAFGEFVIPMLVGGDKYMFVGSLISHYFFLGQNQNLGAAFTVFSSLILLMIIAGAALIMRSRAANKSIGEELV